MSVVIANLALARVGHSRIESLADDDEAARLMADLWPHIRDAELRTHSWSCATRRLELSALEAAPVFGWAHAYQLPSDFLRLLEVGLGPAGATRYALEGRRVLTDHVAPLPVRYVRRLDDEAQMDALLVDGLALRLAAAAAPRLTQSAGTADRLHEVYERTIAQARRVEAIEQPPERLATYATPWMQAHNWLGVREPWRGSDG